MECNYKPLATCTLLLRLGIFLDIHTYVLNTVAFDLRRASTQDVVVGLCWIPRLDNEYLVAELFGFTLEFSYHQLTFSSNNIATK